MLDHSVGMRHTRWIIASTAHFDCSLRLLFARHTDRRRSSQFACAMITKRGSPKTANHKVGLMTASLTGGYREDTGRAMRGTRTVHRRRRTEANDKTTETGFTVQFTVQAVRRIKERSFKRRSLQFGLLTRTHSNDRRRRLSTTLLRNGLLIDCPLWIVDESKIWNKAVLPQFYPQKTSRLSEFQSLPEVVSVGWQRIAVLNQLIQLA